MLVVRAAIFDAGGDLEAVFKLIVRRTLVVPTMNFVVYPVRARHNPGISIPVRVLIIGYTRLHHDVSTNSEDRKQCPQQRSVF